MPDMDEIAARLREKAKPFSRFMIGIAGPPASGKSTMADRLRDALKAQGESAIAVPMDGYHFDDAVLNTRGHRARKGAPYTFDVNGFAHLLKRIKAGEADIAIPVFDRSMELSRAGADIISADVKFIVVEGNYLLLQQPGWAALKPLFDYTIFLKVPEAELYKRLMDRWHSFSFTEERAKAWVESNDLPNIRTVQSESATADLVIE